MSAATKLRFAAGDSPFKRELHRRVDAYFVGRARTATSAQWLKAAFWIGAMASVWAVLTFTSVSGWVGAALAMLLGFCVSVVGFNVAHDATHGSMSSNRTINGLFARLFDLMGASSTMWAWAHNVVHHTFTNVPGVDHDLEPGFYLHLYRRDRRGFLHRFQHLYAWVLYAATSFVWVFKKDFAQLLERKETTAKEVVDVIVWKAVHFGVWLGVPLLAGTHSLLEVLIGYSLMLAVSGFAAAVVFQLAHVVEGPALPTPRGESLDDDFCVHQLKTTANFSARNPIATFLTGGLNHQVEHHLFPRVAHGHYEALSVIVEGCAKEFGVPYYSSSFGGALSAHVRHLKRMGQPDVVSEGAVSPTTA